MNIAETTLTLIELMPQAGIIIDIAQKRVLISNGAAKSYFGIESNCSAEMVSQMMTHAPATEMIFAALRKELQFKGKSTLHHISMKTLTHESEH